MSLLNESKVILSLCDYTGNWAKPYREAGYTVRCIDLKNGDDVRMIGYMPHANDNRVHGILAAPPCTDFSVSGAQYWKAKDENGGTLSALALVDACLRAVAVYRPVWWALENPVGRLKNWLGPHTFAFDPCDFGGYMRPDERSCEISTPQDAYTKKTLLWGQFNIPVKMRVEPVRVCSQGSWIQTLGGKSERTKELRSATPIGFARAFFEANP